MTHPRPLTTLEVETLRVALALLLDMAPESAALHHARAITEVTTIASDVGISLLLRELEGADVTVRRAGP